MENRRTPEDNLQRMEEGRRATVISGIVKPYIDHKITVLIQQMAAEYRAGTAGHDFLLGRTAEITALLNLMIDLERIYSQGVKAASQEIGGHGSQASTRHQ